MRIPASSRAAPMPRAVGLIGPSPLVEATLQATVVGVSSAERHTHTYNLGTFLLGADVVSCAVRPAARPPRKAVLGFARVGRAVFAWLALYQAIRILVLPEEVGLGYVPVLLHVVLPSSKAVDSGA